MDSVAILFRVDGAVCIGTDSGEVQVVSDEEYNQHYARTSNRKVQSIDLRDDGLLSVQRELLGRLQRTSYADEAPVELAVRVQFEEWAYYVKASFVAQEFLWVVWSVQRSMSS